MKNQFRKTITAVTFSLVLFSSCSKNSAAIDAVAVAAKDSVTASVTAGNFVVSSFVQRTEDKTSQFKNIVFKFSANGTLTATDNGTVTNGTWSFTPAVTYYGATSKSAFVINMGASTPLSLLTKTWNISLNSTTLLQIDSPELLEDEHVQFSRL